MKIVLDINVFISGIFSVVLHRKYSSRGGNQKSELF